MKTVRAIAFYLPQFHPIPENDARWGKGFTEWTNVTRARPLFRGHEQPKLPADLGFYDLRLSASREAQANLARAYGIEGFCYWHYWFGNGKTLLETPISEVLQSGKPDFPFCLAWANESWTGIWHGLRDEVLVAQTYPGTEDDRNHFYHVLPAFRDRRYMTVDGKPVFLVYRPHHIPDLPRFLQLWRELAEKEGLPGLHFIAVDDRGDFASFGFDGVVPNSPTPLLAPLAARWRTKARIRLSRYAKRPMTYRYRDLVATFPESPLPETTYPVVLPGWDNTPRSGANGLVLLDSSAPVFKTMVEKAVNSIRHKPLEHRLLFIKSWNEWAEGNYMEPDNKHGHAFLAAFNAATLS